jgi:exosortase
MTGTSRILQFVAVGAVVAAAGVLYQPILSGLTWYWLHNDDYSHSIFVLAAIAYLVWARRDRLRAIELRPSNFGLVIVAVSLAMLMLGTAGVEYFLMRTSAVALIAGAIVFLAGWRWLLALLFPLSLTALVIPVPHVLFYQAAFPLQLLASKFGVAVVQLFQIPVLREGNVIALANTTLEVTEACSGIRSLLSLFALSVLYGYFMHGHNVPRAIVVFSSVPIAIVCNGLRVAGTGIAAHYVGESAATGFFHAFSGWVIFVAATLMLVALSNAMRFVPVLRERSRS